MSYVISVIIKYLGLIGERLQIFTVGKLNVGIFEAGIKSKSYGLGKTVPLRSGKK